MSRAAAAPTRERSRALREAATVCAAFQATAADFAECPALRATGGGSALTWAEYASQVRRLAAGLAHQGVARGDTVGFMLRNRPEFNVVDAAAMHLGAACFSLYNTAAPEQIAYVLQDAGNALLVTERAFLPAVRAAMDLGGVVERVVVIDGDEEGTIPLAEVERIGSEAADFDFEGAWRAVEPEDVLTLIYTSGTTGPPKGVELTHANLVAEHRALDAVERLAPGGRTLSFLPAAHIADRALTHYFGMFSGFEVASCADPREVLAAAVEVRPTLFGAVPRIWEKLKAALEAGFAGESDEGRRAAIADALEAGLRRVRAEQAGAPVPPEDAEACARGEPAIWAPLRERLGFAEVEVFVTGAAPTPVEVLEFFAAIGIEIHELWGMSETSAVATLNPLGAARIGTVGPALPGCELRLADDGELLVRGPIVMRGYRHEPEKTAEAIDGEGWLHTGDIGRLDADGYLTIVDRKKEIIINAAGKNMSPALIEAQVKTASPLIGQALAHGDRRPYVVALITLDPDGAASFAREHDLADASPEALSREPAVREEVAAAVERANAKLSRVEQVKRFTILPVEWEPAGDELTPTMKLKRRPIAAKYAQELEALYA